MAFDLGEALKGVSELGTGREQIEYIRLDLIDEDPNNFYQLSGIEELAANIELCGLQQPIRVRPVPGETERYMIVSGHRRRKAVEMLAQDNPERWGEVPCIVEDDVVSPALQQLRLIYANANTRTMTSSEISEQAVQVEKLLYQLKEEGYEFPGRMRDHVAQAVGASKSKLARLKVIRDGLDAVWKPAFQCGKIGESVAYALARMSFCHQGAVYATRGSNPKSLTEEEIHIFEERMRDIDSVSCKYNSTGTCVNAREMRAKSCKDRWSDPCSARCCYDCNNLRTCGRSCNVAASKKKELKIVEKTAELEAAERQTDRERSRIDLIRGVYLRAGQARQAAGKTVEEVFAAQKRFVTVSSLSSFEELEQGIGKITANTHLPFGLCFDAASAETLISVADCLECSLDWLLGRTGVKELTPEVVSDSDTGEAEPEFIPGAWYPVSVEPPVGVRLILMDSGGYVDTGKYIGCGEYTMDYGDPVTLWTLEPKEKDVAQAAPPVAGWQSGSPEAYGTYVAYVKIAGSDKKSLRELLWDGEEWFLFGSRISETAEVCCWTEQPEW